jgi:uncharacterized membrane protein
MGSLRRNPALPRPGRPIRELTTQRRLRDYPHPMMWGFALWALVHAIVNPTEASLILSFAIAFLALVGAALQDRKKEGAAGDVWRGWKAKTELCPLCAGLKSADGFAL